MLAETKEELTDLLGTHLDVVLVSAGYDPSRWEHYVSHSMRNMLLDVIHAVGPLRIPVHCFAPEWAGKRFGTVDKVGFCIESISAVFAATWRTLCRSMPLPIHSVLRKEHAAHIVARNAASEREMVEQRRRAPSVPPMGKLEQSLSEKATNLRIQVEALRGVGHS